jgi:hypothetical protein
MVAQQVVVTGTWLLMQETANHAATMVDSPLL